MTSEVTNYHEEIRKQRTDAINGPELADLIEIFNTLGMTNELAKLLIDLASENNWPYLRGDLELMEEKNGQYYTGAELAAMGHTFEGLDPVMMYEVHRQGYFAVEDAFSITQALPSQDRFTHREVPSKEIVAILVQAHQAIFPSAEDDGLVAPDDYNGPHPRPYAAAKSEFQVPLADLVIK